MFYKKKIVLTDRNQRVYHVIDAKSEGAGLAISSGACRDSECEMVISRFGKLYSCGKTPLTYKIPDWQGEEIHVALRKKSEIFATGSTEGNHFDYLFAKEREKTKEKKATPSPEKVNTPISEPEIEKEPELKELEIEEKEKEPIKEVKEQKEEPKCDGEYKAEEKKERETHEFYCSIKQNLDEMLICYPREERLSSVIDESEWVKVERKEGFYVVGLIKSEGSPEYVCYGVPGEKDLLPPESLKKYCQWIPLSDKEGDGYWMVFQDAKTGIALENKG